MRCLTTDTVQSLNALDDGEYLSTIWSALVTHYLAVDKNTLKDTYLTHHHMNGNY